MHLRGLKTAKKRAENCRRRQFSARFLPFLGPLQPPNHYKTIFFLKRRFQASIWWVKRPDRLRIGFRNEYFSFTSQNQVDLDLDLDELHILKIGFRNGW